MVEPTPITKKRRYTKRQRATVVIAAEMSSVTAAAEATGIPATTIDYWMDQPEFVRLREKTREDMAEESKALAHKVLGVIAGKLDTFEARDLTILYGVLVDKGQLLSGEATSRHETKALTDGMDDHEREALRKVLEEVMEVEV